MALPLGRSCSTIAYCTVVRRGRTGRIARKSTAPLPSSTQRTNLPSASAWNVGRDGDAASGVPLVLPPGGHAVYIDARALLPHIPPLQYPGQSLAVALYEAGGIRSVEIGTVMFGRHPDGSEAPAAMDLVRMAIPRRTYTQSHVDYVIEVVRAVAERAADLRGYRITYEPQQLRHFTARFAPC